MLNPHDLHIRTIHANGKGEVSVHRVWDSDRFIEARRAEGKEAGRKKSSDGYTVEIITEADYRKARKP